MRMPAGVLLAVITCPVMVIAQANRFKMRVWLCLSFQVVYLAWRINTIQQADDATQLADTR